MAETSQNSGDSSNQTSPNPPITMKVDAPVEETKPEVDDNEKNSMRETENFKMCSPSTGKTPTPSNPFTISYENKSVARSILKPPQLSLNNSTNSSSKSTFVLNPSRLNPFAKTTTTNNDKEEKKSSNLINGETPKFVPLLHSDTKTNSTQPVAKTNSDASSSSSFVFGQNLQERVVTAKNEEPKPSTSLNSNGTTEMLFSSAIKNEVKADVTSPNKETKSLSESAREYQESRASKRKYEEVEVITGEEGETNILNTTCKLFAFDKSSGSWQERGRGILRLNDLEGEDHTQSRLVFRTTGSLRVILNTKIWAEMTVEQASEKSIRFTALDADGMIRVFLAMASIEDSKQLFSQIQCRVHKEVIAQKHKKVVSDNKDSGDN